MGCLLPVSLGALYNLPCPFPLLHKKIAPAGGSSGGVPWSVLSPSMVSDLAHGRVERGFQLYDGSIDGLHQGIVHLSDHDGLHALHAGFHQAALISLPFLAAVFVRQMHLHAGQLTGESVQFFRNFIIQLRFKGFMDRDVVIGIDLYNHDVLICI